MPFLTEPTEAECFEAEQELLFDVHFRQLDREIRKMIEQDKQKGATTPTTAPNGYQRGLKDDEATDSTD